MPIRKALRFYYLTCVESFDFVFDSAGASLYVACQTVQLLFFSTQTHNAVSINKEAVRHMQACQQFSDKRANAPTSTWLRYGIEDLCSFMRKQEKEIIITDQRNYY